jgi:diguanylate cyclase (GGDEF)-like protein
MYSVNGFDPIDDPMTNPETTWKPNDGEDALNIANAAGFHPEAGWPVIDAIADPVVVFDHRAIVRHANPAAVSRLGFDPTGRSHVAVGKRMKLRTISGEAAPAGAHPAERALHGETVQGVQFLFDGANEKESIALVSAAPILQDNGVVGAVVVFQDITQNRRSEEAIRRETARLELLSSLSQAIAEAGLYYPAVLSTIAQLVAESIGDGCIIRLLSDDGQWLDPVAFHHTDPDAFRVYRSALHASRRRVDEGYSGQVYKTGEPLIVSEVSQDELLNLEWTETAAAAQQYPVQNGIVVPLRAQNRVIGTLIVFRSHRQAPFSSEDQTFLQDLAARAALAIENARLYAAEAQRARELDALHRAASALLSTLDLDALLGQILDAAQNAIPAAEKGLLHLINPGTSELRVRAMLGYQNPRIQKISGGSEQDYLLKAVDERRALLVHDTLAGKDDPTGADVHPVPTVRSAVVAPLIVENKVLGVLSLSSGSPSAFGDADLRLLTSLAATTTAAIQNALLHSEVQQLAITDALTGLYNRRGFFDLGQREIDRFQRFGRPLTAIMLDIDHFKEVNDTHGHSVGDQVLATLARRFRTNIRHVDILCRYGGEEFAILLPETDLFTASEIAERIRRSIADEPFQTDHGQMRVTISLGVTRALPETADLQALLERADGALYRAKSGGRNRVEIA